MTVTLTVTVTDSTGNETVQTHTFDAGGGSTPLSGDVSGVYGDAHIVGDVNLTGDLVIEGLLTGVDTFTLNGNGFQLLFQNGGRPNLAGVEKTAWTRWGETPVGWQTGDRVAVAPTATGVYVPIEILWGAARPANSPDVTLVDGTVAKPEVVNLTQTIVLKNLRRIHFHDGAGVATLKWLRVLNCGAAGVLAEYPIHFHLNGEASRGSVLEGVVVEGGKNHAFVPHGSHGVTYKDCVAYNTKNHAYWWDRTNDNPLNDSDDIRFEKCLALKVTQPSPSQSRLTGFMLGGGSNNACVDSVAVGVAASDASSGFHWPEDGSAVWEFTNCVGHNNVIDGIFTWQNSPNIHMISAFTAYRNGRYGVEHGAYTNRYHYDGLTLSGQSLAFGLHALGGQMVIENVVTDGELRILKHNIANVTTATTFRNCQFSQVVYKETSNSGTNGSKVAYHDCGLTPTDFDLAGIIPVSIVEVYEANVLAHRWAGGWA